MHVVYLRTDPTEHLQSSGKVITGKEREPTKFCDEQVGYPSRQLGLSVQETLGTHVRGTSVIPPEE